MDERLLSHNECVLHVPSWIRTLRRHGHCVGFSRRLCIACAQLQFFVTNPIRTIIRSFGTHWLPFNGENPLFCRRIWYFVDEYKHKINLQFNRGHFGPPLGRQMPFLMNMLDIQLSHNRACSGNGRLAYVEKPC